VLASKAEREKRRNKSDGKKTAAVRLQGGKPCRERGGGQGRMRGGSSTAAAHPSPAFCFCTPLTQGGLD